MADLLAAADLVRVREETLPDQESRPPVHDDLVKREFTADHLDQLWLTLNTRPRKSLDWKTPAEALNEQLLLLQQLGVATTG